MSIGSFIRRATTIPKHGILSPLRKVFGSTPLDEIGAAAGFAIGGPAGAAIGSGVGSLAHGANVGSALGNAAKYGLAGVGANAALGAAGGGLSGATANLSHDLGGLGNLGKTILGSRVPGSGTDAVGGTTRPGGLGGLLTGAVDWLTDPQKGENRLRLLGTAVGGAGALMQGNAESSQANATNSLNRDALALQQQAQNFNQQQALSQQTRNASYDPYRTQILQALIDRMNQPRTGGY